MQTIRSVGILSVAKILGVLYACIALVFVPFFLIFAALGLMANPGDNPMNAFGTAGLVLLACMMPVLYGAMGFVGGAIAAFGYNLLAKWLGGIQIELQLMPPSPAASLPTPVLFSTVGQPTV